MSKIDIFEREESSIKSLDFQGYGLTSVPVFRQYQHRNSFGLDPNKKIHRIFQTEYLNNDILNGYLTLPRASASIWKDPLENPLSDVKDIDSVTGGVITLGDLVNSFHAICWTHRDKPEASDWKNFSHGKKAIRITTSVGKLMDRIMSIQDSYYMHRAWLIEVEYKDPAAIAIMQNPPEVYRRTESSGALLALAAAIVRTSYSSEDEIRLLFDASLQPYLEGMIVLKNPDRIQIPFEWNGFIENQEFGP
ncbi:MAG: hypothetical protein HRU77_11430 [Gammaproteobacteria bacterium]|nr:MAG: hypothetical protein HRU77_11430 [Gammaproteobacteria bacterium]